MKRLGIALAACALFTAQAGAQDITVSKVGGGSDFDYYGQSGGIAAYSMATTACNVGTIEVNWQDHLAEEPVIAQNLFRIKDDRIEHLGYSFLKHSFCAVSEPNCAACQPNATCNWLAIGCADTYWSGLNDGSSGGAKWQIQANTGVHSHPYQGPTTDPPTIRGRLQTLASEMANPGAIYIAEAQYVSEHDQMAGNARNNQSWHRVNNTSVASLTLNGPVNIGDPAIFAWEALDGATVVEAPNLDEGGPGVHGWFYVGHKVVDLGNGSYRYEYAVQNTTSDQAGGTFSIPLPCDGVTVSNLFFRGVRHHSGSPISNAAWTSSVTSSEVSWECEPFAQNSNASAIRWGELFNFGFTADRAPGATTATLGLFKPGTGTEVVIPVEGPGANFTIYCAVNANSTGSPAGISAEGSPFLSANDVTFNAFDLPAFENGYFLMADSTGFIPNFGNSSGNLCLGQPIVRFANNVLNTNLFGAVTFSPDLNNLPQNVNIMPGETWNYQFWYRDGQDSNTTAGVSITFCQ